MLFASMLICFAAPALATSAWVWPMPQTLSAHGDPLALSSQFKFTTDVQSGILSRAKLRYEAYIVANATGSSDALQTCSVSVSNSDERLAMNTSYKHTLSLSGGSCSIHADTVFGAIYGMESLYQLGANGTLPNGDIVMEDYPDYAHRGMMIDTGRRFWPVTLVKNIIDVMSFDKMNVLHLHASDMCRFGVESKLFPELTESLAGIKAGHYTQEDIKDLVVYGRDRGVRILPEFDMPGHAACFIPMAPRGLEWCNKPNESPIPNWCTLKATNGTAAWNIMPQLALEMAELFGSEVYHIGGDETRCSGSGSFENMLLDMLAERGFRGMGWSEVQGAMRNDTIIHAWKSGMNATKLATQGIASVDSNPGRFYRGVGKSTPDVVTKAWSDLDKESIPKENQHLLLGGELAFWTDTYCYINGCVRPGSPRGEGADLFGPHRDEEFSRSAGGMLWPYGHLAAGSFWHYDRNLEVDEVASRAMHKQNTLASWRGGLVCPTGCECTVTSVCGESLLPTPPPSPPAPQSKECVWHSDTGIEASDFKTVPAVRKEECCAVCQSTDGCVAADFNPLERLCHLKHEFKAVWRNDGSLACIPSNQTFV